MDLLVSMHTFVEVVQTGSMSAAAQKLNVTSALVGQRISALEAHLKVRLLNRTTRQHSLTEFGERYLEQCRDILEMVALSEGQASDQQRKPQGRLRIAAPLSFGTEALAPALNRFSEMAPDVEIDLVLSDSNEDLIVGGFDVAFRIGTLEDSTLLQTSLRPYRMVICASPSYLCERGPLNTPHDLDKFNAVLFSKSARKPWRFSKGAQTVNWVPKARTSMNSGHAVRAAVKSGMGIAMLPEVLVQSDLASGSLVHLLPDWLLPEQPMSLIYYRDRYRPQRLVRFIEFAKATFANRAV